MRSVLIIPFSQPILDLSSLLSLDSSLPIFTSVESNDNISEDNDSIMVGSESAPSSSSSSEDSSSPWEDFSDDKMKLDEESI